MGTLLGELQRLLGVMKLLLQRLSVENELRNVELYDELQAPQK